jgi:hypothetical protein
MNIYFVDQADVKRELDMIRGIGGSTWQGPFGIAPGHDGDVQNTNVR